MATPIELSLETWLLTQVIVFALFSAAFWRYAQAFAFKSTPVPYLVPHIDYTALENLRIDKRSLITRQMEAECVLTTARTENTELRSQIKRYEDQLGTSQTQIQKLTTENSELNQKLRSLHDLVPQAVGFVKTICKPYSVQQRRKLYKQNVELKQEIEALRRTATKARKTTTKRLYKSASIGVQTDESGLSKPATPQTSVTTSAAEGRLVPSDDPTQPLSQQRVAKGSSTHSKDADTLRNSSGLEDTRSGPQDDLNYGRTRNSPASDHFEHVIGTDEKAIASDVCGSNNAHASSVNRMEASANPVLARDDLVKESAVDRSAVQEKLIVVLKVLTLAPVPPSEKMEETPKSTAPTGSGSLRALRWRTHTRSSSDSSSAISLDLAANESIANGPGSPLTTAIDSHFLDELTSQLESLALSDTFPEAVEEAPKQDSQRQKEVEISLTVEAQGKAIPVPVGGILSTFHGSANVDALPDVSFLDALSATYVQRLIFRFGQVDITWSRFHLNGREIIDISARDFAALCRAVNGSRIPEERRTSRGSRVVAGISASTKAVNASGSHKMAVKYDRKALLRSRWNVSMRKQRPQLRSSKRCRIGKKRAEPTTSQSPKTSDQDQSDAPQPMMPKTEPGSRQKDQPHDKNEPVAQEMPVPGPTTGVGPSDSLPSETLKGIETPGLSLSSAKGVSVKPPFQNGQSVDPERSADLMTDELDIKHKVRSIDRPEHAEASLDGESALERSPKVEKGPPSASRMLATEPSRPTNVAQSPPSEDNGNIGGNSPKIEIGGDLVSEAESTASGLEPQLPTSPGPQISELAGGTQTMDTGNETEDDDIEFEDVVPTRNPKLQQAHENEGHNQPMQESGLPVPPTVNTLDSYVSESDAVLEDLSVPLEQAVETNDTADTTGFIIDAQEDVTSSGAEAILVADARERAVEVEMHEAYLQAYEIEVQHRERMITEGTHTDPTRFEIEVLIQGIAEATWQLDGLRATQQMNADPAFVGKDAIDQYDSELVRRDILVDLDSKARIRQANSAADEVAAAAKSMRAQYRHRSSDYNLPKHGRHSSKKPSTSGGCKPLSYAPSHRDKDDGDDDGRRKIDHGTPPTATLSRHASLSQNLSTSQNNDSFSIQTTRSEGNQSGALPQLEKVGNLDLHPMDEGPEDVMLSEEADRTHALRPLQQTKLPKEPRNNDKALEDEARQMLKEAGRLKAREDLVTVFEHMCKNSDHDHAKYFFRIAESERLQLRKKYEEMKAVSCEKFKVLRQKRLKFPPNANQRNKNPVLPTGTLEEIGRQILESPKMHNFDGNIIDEERYEELAIARAYEAMFESKRQKLLEKSKKGKTLVWLREYQCTVEVVTKLHEEWQEKAGSAAERQEWRRRNLPDRELDTDVWPLTVGQIARMVKDRLAKS